MRPGGLFLVAATGALGALSTTRAQGCYQTGERAIGAPGHRAVGWKPCCNADDVLVEKLGTWGKFCMNPNEDDCGGEETVAPPARPSPAPAKLTPSPMPSTTPTPAEPTLTPVPSTTPTPVPSTTPTPVPSTTPTPVPSTTPTPAKPTPSPIPSVIPTPSPTPSVTPMPAVPTPTPVTDKCDGFGKIVRKEVKDLSPDEWNNFVEAHRRLRENGKYAGFSRAHGNPAYAQHGNGYFLIWHRLMLAEWDRALGAAVPGVVQPYYDWSKVSGDMFSDEVWQRGGRFGGDGDSIPDGSFAGLPVVRQFQKHLLLQSKQNLRSLVETTRGYGDFTNALEVAHNMFHVMVGGPGTRGDMADFARAPNDPVFYFHHAFIDKIWKDWQLVGNKLKVSPDLDLDVVMEPWGKTARQVLEASECIEYQGSTGGSLAGDQVFATNDEFAFETRAEKVEAEREAAEKKIASPELVKAELEVEIKREQDMREASLVLGADPKSVDKAVKVMRDVQLQGDTSIDLADADVVAAASADEIVASAEQELALLDQGELPPTKQDTRDVKNTSA